MILGLFDPTASAHTLERELREALARLGPGPGAPVVWSGGTMAAAWAPTGIPTLDEPDQPFVSAEGAVTVLFEGKVHNAADIRARFSSRAWRSASSGETLAHLYAENPDGFLEPVNGKFAAAVWDAHRNRLILVRDRLGIEPMFYARQGNRLVFSTSLRALLKAGWAGKQINREALLQYLVLCYNPGDNTVIEGVRKLPAAHCLIADGSAVSERRYWSLSFAGSTASRPESEYRTEIARLIEDAVRLRMEADASPGLFLSGGIDSSGIAVLASRRSSGPLRSFSFRCAGPSYDESRYARLMAGSCRTEHTEVTYGPDRLRMIEQAVRGMDEPVSDIGIEIGTFLMGQAAQGKVSYVFSGEGGDELFGGHPAYSADKVAAVTDRIPRAILQPVARLLQRLPDTEAKKSLSVKLKRFSYSLAFPADLLSHRWRVYYTPRELAAVCAPLLHGGVDPDRAFDGIRRYAREADGPDMLSRSLYCDFFTLVGFYLRRLQLLRAWGIESRTPLLDHRLVEYAATIPSRLKLRGFSDTKYIYKRALEGIVPHEILYDRPKLGHSVPMKNWLREDPALQGWIRGVLLDGSLAGRGLIDSQAVGRMLEEHQRRAQNFSHRLWALVVLELWLRQHPVEA